MQGYWINWTLKDGCGHSTVTASHFTREHLREKMLNDSRLWPTNHRPESTFETINGEVV